MKIVAAALALLCAAACARPEPAIVLATTTSVANSGLLDKVLPSYTDARVRAVHVGSGRALEMLAAGSADVVISHAPVREAQALETAPHWWYRKILFNDFLVVGPPDDPARLEGLSDPVVAMKRIIEAGSRFLSRGDESGTHERERQLWAQAGITPPAHQVVVAGAGMGQTLRVANEVGAYTLTDRGTFEALSGSLKLRVFVSGDARLLNTYAVVVDPASTRGYAFARWLAEGDGRRALGRALSSGDIRGFTLWPEGAPNARPDVLPR